MILGIPPFTIVPTINAIFQNVKLAIPAIFARNARVANSNRSPILIPAAGNVQSTNISILMEIATVVVILTVSFVMNLRLYAMLASQVMHYRSTLQLRITYAMKLFANLLPF